MSRIANALGFSVVWSASPPPSPTFSVAPGGTAILARRPLELHELRIPSLERWRMQARLCTACIVDASKNKVVFASCYGFPLNHEERRANESLLESTLSELSEMICPAFLMGDMNDHPTTSNALAKASAMGMYRLSDDSPTTLNKQGAPATKLPIDHCFGNRVAMECGYKCKTDPTLVVSDHVPILLQLHMSHPHFQQVVWPKPQGKMGPVLNLVPWTSYPATFQQWQEDAAAWLQQSYGVSITPKGRLEKKLHEPPKPPRNLKFRRLLTLQKAAIELANYPKRSEQVMSLTRKIKAMGQYAWLNVLCDPPTLVEKVRACINGVFSSARKKSLKKWKSVAREWRTSDAAAFKFLRNPMPSRVVTIQKDDLVLTHPLDIESCLLESWGALENCPVETTVKALEALEQKYSFLLPTHEHAGTDISTGAHE